MQPALPEGVRPHIDRLAPELDPLLAAGVAEDGVSGRLASVELAEPLALAPGSLLGRRVEQLPALALGGLVGVRVRSPACWPAAASRRTATVTAFMRPPAIDWAIKNLNSEPDRLRIKSYDYKYRRRAGVVNEILLLAHLPWTNGSAGMARSISRSWKSGCGRRASRSLSFRM